MTASPPPGRGAAAGPDGRAAPGAVSGPDAVPRSGGPLRVGLVGAGFFSRFHLEGWQSVAGAVVTAICDRDAERAHAVARASGVEAAFDDARAMLDAGDIDLLDIVAPPDAHAGLVRLARDHGLPAICQKPFAGGYARARALLDELPAEGPPIVVHENFRFSPWYREMRAWIDSGRLGRLHSIGFRLRPGDGQGPSAYLDRQPYFQRMPRFLVHETATHFVDTFRYLFGEIRSVGARLRRLNPAIAGEDAGVIVFGFDDDRLGIFDGNRLNEHPARDQRRTMGECWLEGEGGVLRLDGDARLFFKGHGEPERRVDYDPGPATFAGGACGRLQAHVVRHLLAGAPLENRAHDYLRNLRIVEAVYASAAQGRFIEVDAQ